MRFVVTIDTEEEWDWQGGFPVREYSVENIARLDRFHDLCQRFGVATTYFTNHAVLDNSAAASVIKGFSQTNKTEIGMHVHPWLTPPLGDSGPNDYNTREMSFLENLPGTVARKKLETTYQRHLDHGFLPTSFRGGRYSTGRVTQEFLLKHRFLVDASICPFSTWEDRGAPDYRYQTEQPTRIGDSNDANATPLWSLPLTRVYSRRPFLFWNSIFTGIEHSWISKLRLIGILEATRIARRIWLNFETESAERMLWLIQNAARLQLPYLCFTVHSSSLSVGPSPYARSQDQVDRIFDGIERTFQLLNRLPEFEPSTISEIAIALEKQA
ncbi:polysaccharide deacetylase family protein [Stieleria varia]|uniref:Polysaccharide deacetylase n=1 Tax=Stieleria varia TaxID=2528005 RepID=A0A5C6AP47_9BACT|nr:hypothetical protein [Stieleria varia]TWU01278.1 hypothetical protein Pla52n_46520 [Stieleria varia]